MTRRVRITREGQAPFWQTEGFDCPCCGQPTRREFEQPALLPGRPPTTKTDCLNPDCPAYYATLSRDAFMQRFSPSPVRGEGAGG